VEINEGISDKKSSSRHVFLSLVFDVCFVDIGLCEDFITSAE
jgi:hypothetical protein